MESPVLEGPSDSVLDAKLKLQKPARWASGVFLIALAGGLVYAGSQLMGVAGTMAANKSGLQWMTVRNMLMAWVLTLPISIGLSASLFWAFSHF